MIRGRGQWGVMLAAVLVLGVAVGVGVFWTGERAHPTNATLVSPQGAVPMMSASGVAFHAEVADSPIERSTGLMYRKALAEDTGMLFVFPEDTLTSFWMANTYLPLDIAFLDGIGTILEIHQRADTRSTDQTVPGTPYRYALEMSLGWFGEHDLRIGQRIVIPE